MEGVQTATFVFTFVSIAFMKVSMRNPAGGVVVLVFFQKMCVGGGGGGAGERASDEVASARFYERRSREGACEIFLPPNKSGFAHALAPYLNVECLNVSHLNVSTFTFRRSRPTPAGRRSTFNIHGSFADRQETETFTFNVQTFSALFRRPSPRSTFRHSHVQMEVIDVDTADFEGSTEGYNSRRQLPVL